MAHQALLVEEKIGTMLPSNVVVQATENGDFNVAAVDPVASIQAADNVARTRIAGIVRGKLEQVIDTL